MYIVNKIIAKKIKLNYLKNRNKCLLYYYLVNYQSYNLHYIILRFSIIMLLYYYCNNYIIYCETNYLREKIFDVTDPFLIEANNNENKPPIRDRNDQEFEQDLRALRADLANVRAMEIANILNVEHLQANILDNRHQVELEIQTVQNNPVGPEIQEDIVNADKSSINLNYIAIGIVVTCVVVMRYCWLRY